MIKVSNLTKNFGSKIAVNNVSFSVQKGEVLGFLGPNGAGKSTTIRMIAGYILPTQGSVYVEGKDVQDEPMVSKKLIGYMPESNPLYKEMTTKEFLSFTAEIHGMPDIPKCVQETVELTNLQDVTDQLIETLSKGYRSRLSFAAAIIHNPPILLLDEPTDGLDPNQKNEIRTLIKGLSKDKAIIVSTHILEEVEAMCSRVVIISEGSIVLDGPPSKLKENNNDNKKVIISIPLSEKDKTESALSSKLRLIDNWEGDKKRFIIDDVLDLNQIKTKLLNENVQYEEVFYYDAPLDEAFRKLTKIEKN